MLNISQLLEARANKSPDGIAILADQRSPATWNSLYLQAQKVLRMLRAAGIGRRDRVAIVSPNGPEMAVAFLTISSCAESAPLNPAYRANEFAFYLSDLRPKALIINGFHSPAEIVARDLGIPIIELVPQLQQEAGMFNLKIEETSATEGEGFTQADDVGIILHTSGTTSKPKIVPLTQANICHSASNIAKSLNLTGRDRCLNVMPLFHIHGLIGAVLSSTFAGASLVCTNDFYAPHFFEWIKQFDPTWYTAVPTMHQAILSRAKQNFDIIARSSLRFIRSSSAPLPRQVLHQLEKTFRVPVLEAFGMTEASHQVSTNPLPPGKSKPGSVGLPAGTEVAIMNDHGELQERGEPGEIVIRGANVTFGYQNNPEANRSAFHRGWFRTGDEGYLDEDGYLFITCRKKEIINRGGEKISPYEVEEVFLSHPAVKEAVCFAVPDVTLGEEVGAAVVVHENIPTTELDLREFASLRLSDFKIPRRVVFLKELPKSSTGKLQRLTLADQLGLKSIAEKSPAATEFVSARDPLEAQIAEIWKQILGLRQVGINDNFFYLGGDSILATRIILQIQQTLQREISLLSFFENPTIAELAGRLKPIPAKEVSLEFIAAKPCLSFAQEQMFFFTQVFPDGFAYNRPAYLRVRGSLNSEVLERCLSEIVRRHDALRTTIQFQDNRPSPVVLPPSSVHVEILNLTRIPEEKREAELLKLAIDETRKPFNLQTGPLYRIGLVKLSEEDHVLQMTFHHITFDDWSMNVLLEELSMLYEAYSEGRESPLTELAVRYSDFAQRQRTSLQGEAADRLRTYWRKQLANHSTLHFPLSRPRPRFQTFNGAREEIDLSADLADALRKLAREEHVTLFMLLLAAFQVLVGKYTEQTDISIGTPTRGRNQPELENLIGVFINMIVLRTDLSGDPSFVEFLKRVRDVAIQAYAHQDLPFPMVVSELRPKRDLSMSPLFQITFQLRNDFERKVILSNQEMVEFKFDPGIAPMDLTLEVLNRDNHLSCLLIYNTDLFDASVAAEVLRNYEIILKRIAANSKDRLSDLMRATLNGTAVQSYSDRPVSAAQEGFWFSCQLFPDKPILNLVWNLNFTGPLNTSRLMDSLKKILERHEVLRASFSLKNDEILQSFHPEQPLEFRTCDLSAFEAQEKENQIKKITREFGWKRFNLSSGPLIRFFLIGTASECYELLVAMHHIVTDGVSWSVFVDELLTLYKGEEPTLLNMAYGDFADRQRKMIRTGWQDHESFWKNKFAGVDASLEIPPDHSRPKIPSHSGDVYESILSAEIKQQLTSVYKKAGATLFRSLFAAFLAFLSRITGQSSIILGTTLAVRERPELRKLIGPFGNPAALHVELVEDLTFPALLTQVNEEMKLAIQHQIYPFEKAIPPSKSMQDLKRLTTSPISFTKLPRSHRRSVNSLEIEDRRVFLNLALNDLTVYSQEVDEEIRLTWVYSTDLFERESIVRFSHQFQTFLQGIVAHPEERISKLPLLTKQERNQLILDWNNTAVEFPPQCIPDLFEMQVSRNPDATALIFENHKWTYRELNERANQLAHSLRDRGIGPEQMVGLCLERSPEMIWGMLGILKAGGGYVPLDPADPKLRLKRMLEDAKPALLLTQRRLDLQEFYGETLLLDGESSRWMNESITNPKSVTLSSHLAYTIYTSGSTGKPKGVLATHGNVANYLQAVKDLFSISTTDIVLMTTPFSFDASGRSIFGSLLAGAALLLPSETEALQPWSLASRIREQGITCILSIVPTFLRTLVDAANEASLSFPSVRLIVISGEPLFRSLCEKTQQTFPNALLINKYGPTECTMTSTYYRIPPAGLEQEMAPIGKPLANCRIYILDRNMETMPVGIPGELHIGGSGVTRGYLNLPDLTKKSFIPDPFSGEGERLYKSGDLARYRRDGNLEFLGRTDQQLKVHGVRIEAGEVETALDEHDAVKRSAVVTREDTFGEKVLVAYILLRKDASPSLTSLRSFLRHRLPGYMVPSHFVFLDALPLTPNGKIDRRRLPLLERGTDGIGSRDSMGLHLANRPRSKTEEQLLSIWSEVLDLKDIGTRMNFFDIGGHSLSAMQILSRIHQRLGVDVTIRDFFDQPTIAGIGLLVDRISLQP